ncbi:serine protease [Hyphomonas sp.]|uniref:S1 family peptidase n=1 Tax=Hyphomonas sp. TaxID=87 RepID=UPI00391D7A20
MRGFDWVLYAAVLGFILYVLFTLAPEAEAPPPPPVSELAEELGPLLPDPSPLDELVVVQAGPPQNGVGTAFAVNARGDWLTARHVVDGCARVSLMVAPGNYVPVARIALDDAHDLAILSTGRSPNPVRLDLASPLFIGAEGYHVGFPQGEPGELASRLVGRSRLVTRGLRDSEAPILAWAEVGRTSGLTGTLGGISGGPVFDSNGSVRGVIVAESPRRGRVYTTAPQSVEAFLTRQGIEAQPGLTNEFALRTYGTSSDTARRRLQVVKVMCEVAP